MLSITNNALDKMFNSSHYIRSFSERESSQPFIVTQNKNLKLALPQSYIINILTGSLFMLSKYGFVPSANDIAVMETKKFYKTSLTWVSLDTNGILEHLHFVCSTLKTDPSYDIMTALNYILAHSCNARTRFLKDWQINRQKGIASFLEKFTEVLQLKVFLELCYAHLILLNDVLTHEETVYDEMNGPNEMFSTEEMDLIIQGKSGGDKLFAYSQTVRDMGLKFNNFNIKQAAHNQIIARLAAATAGVPPPGLCWPQEGRNFILHRDIVTTVSSPLGTTPQHNTELSTQAKRNDAFNTDPYRPDSSRMESSRVESAPRNVETVRSDRVGSESSRVSRRESSRFGSRDTDSRFDSTYHPSTRHGETRMERDPMQYHSDRASSPQTDLPLIVQPQPVRAHFQQLSMQTPSPTQTPQILPQVFQNQCPVSMQSYSPTLISPSPLIAANSIPSASRNYKGSTSVDLDLFPDVGEVVLMYDKNVYYNSPPSLVRSLQQHQLQMFTNSVIGDVDHIRGDGNSPFSANRFGLVNVNGDTTASDLDFHQTNTPLPSLDEDRPVSNMKIPLNALSVKIDQHLYTPGTSVPSTPSSRFAQHDFSLRVAVQSPQLMPCAPSPNTTTMVRRPVLIYTISDLSIEEDSFRYSIFKEVHKTNLGGVFEGTRRVSPKYVYSSFLLINEASKPCAEFLLQDSSLSQGMIFALTKDNDLISLSAATQAVASANAELQSSTPGSPAIIAATPGTISLPPPPTTISATFVLSNEDAMLYQGLSIASHALYRTQGIRGTLIEYSYDNKTYSLFATLGNIDDCPKSISTGGIRARYWRLTRPNSTVLAIGYFAFTQSVAVKRSDKVILNEQKCGDDPRRECKYYRYLSGCLSTPSFIAMHDNEAFDSKYHWIVTQFMDGQDVYHLLNRGRDPRNLIMLPEVDVGLLFAQVVLSVYYMHHYRNVCHLDLKPANILLSHNYKRACVTDYGVMRRLTPNNTPYSDCVNGELTHDIPEPLPSSITGARGADLLKLLTTSNGVGIIDHTPAKKMHLLYGVFGTKDYMAPEIISAHQKVNEREKQLNIPHNGVNPYTSCHVCGSKVHALNLCQEHYAYEYGFDGRLADVFSLGVILFTMLTKIPPFTGFATSTNKHFNALMRHGPQYLIDAYRHQYPNIRVDPNAVDLMKHMMDCNTQSRYYIEDVVEHPFMSKYFGLLRDYNF